MNRSYFYSIYIKILQKLLNLMYKLYLPKTLCVYLNDFIENYVHKRLQKYFKNASSSLSNNNGKNSKVIWIFWWQGKNDMPLVVEKCINSIIKNSTNHKVIFIDKNNVRNYAKLPDFIYDKLNWGCFDLTHFSDILRMNLLRNYGGLWIDSTVFCSSKITDNYFDYLYTSSGYPQSIPRFVNGKWLSFLIGGNSNNQLFQFMDNYFQQYWKHNNHQLNYFMLDHGLYYAYKHNIGNFKICSNNNINSNIHLLDLLTYFDAPYDYKLYKELLKDTNLFKLTYKKKFMKKNNGKKTFYYKFINNEL